MCSLTKHVQDRQVQIDKTKNKVVLIYYQYLKCLYMCVFFTIYLQKEFT